MLPSCFDPLIRDWFEETFGAPTAVQTEAWPAIAGGEHALITAPTGSGKTLTAFLWALDRLLTGAWRPGRVRVLYVSPLRALNTDIRRNLTEPLESLTARFEAADREVPTISAMTRSGDTPQRDRQRMLRRPPEILITTPESLNILLTSVRGRDLLGGIRTVILDEIHAVAGGKRGTHLITAIDRLVPLAGDVQRIALSATVEPLDVVGAFVAGFTRTEVAGAQRFDPRPIRLVRPPITKRVEVSVHCPWFEDPAAAIEDGASLLGDGETDARAGGRGDDEETLWEGLADAVRGRIDANRSTLVFANSRRATEKLTHHVNDGAGRIVAYAHHGSLSREVRTEVERRLKRGDLEAIVSTSSLELGIDIGSLDEVLMVQTPPSVAAATQRVGRAGHGVGETSVGRLYPIHPRDVLDAAVVAEGVLGRRIERIVPVEMPLDLLAQIILSMVATEAWTVDDLLAVLRTSWPYRNLRRRQLDLVLDMLGGRYADTRIRELRPRVTVDALTGTVTARPGVARLVYQSGGTIPDRGYFTLRLADSRIKLGELDEEFVWERSVGDRFTLGTQTWQIRGITHNDVLVVPRGGSGAMAPFWRADALDRPFAFAARVGRFLARSEGDLAKPGFTAHLESAFHLDGRAAMALVTFLRDQKAATGCLPHRRRLLVERLRGAREGTGSPILLHTLWGGKVNRPFAMALESAWRERFDTPLETDVDDTGVLLRPGHHIDLDVLLSLIDAERVEEHLRRRLETTGFFGAQFRIAAQAAMLLPRAGFRHRTPLWLSRQRAKKLLTTVAPLGDFPVVVETWRACLRDAFDLPSLKQVLAELEEGAIEVVEVETGAPSPFAGALAWTETNRLMYEDDTPESAGESMVRPDLLEEVVFAGHLRPRLPADLVAEFDAKASRTAEGYAPRPGDDLAHWIGERLLVSEEEVDLLLAAVARDHLAAEERPAADALGPALLGPIADRVGWLRLGAHRALASVASVARIARALDVVADAIEDGLGWHAIEVADEETRSTLEARIEAAFARQPGPESGTSSADDPSMAEPEADDANREAALVAEWLRHRGPVVEEAVAALFGLRGGRWTRILETLEGTRTVVVDPLTEGTKVRQVIDAENLERLLRWLRRARRMAAETRPAGDLALFFAAHQGLARSGPTGPGDGIDALERRLEQLVGFPAPAAHWETAILPARIDPYYPAWLDSLMQQSEVFWQGMGTAKLTFAYAADRDLLVGDDASPGEHAVDVQATESLFPDPHGRYPIHALAEIGGADPEVVSERLWRAAWEGEATSDTFEPVRRAAARRFKPEASTAGAAARMARDASTADSAARSATGRLRGRLPRARMPRGRRGQDRGFVGTWRALPLPVPPADALDRELMAKERVRVLLERYGLLFRQLLARETPAFHWSRVFRALRLMELSGEVLAGRFFDGIDGLQFLSLDAWRTLRRGLPSDAVYWMNATDPASLAGLGDLGLDGLPARRPTSWMAYRGATLVLVATRGGKTLDIHEPADHPRVEETIRVLGHLLGRAVMPKPSILVETINDGPASESPYRPVLDRRFRVTREGGALRLWKRFRSDLAED